MSLLPWWANLAVSVVAAVACGIWQLNIAAGFFAFLLFMVLISIEQNLVLISLKLDK